MIDSVDAKPAPRPMQWAPFITALQQILAKEPHHVYLVGGVVRDAFWGRPAHDVDLAVASGAFAVARRIANTYDGAFYKLDAQRETGRAIVDYEGDKIIVDVATFRGDDLHDDLLGRDFTLNAVAAPLTGDLQSVIDPLKGLDDAQQRILRRCSNDSIASDPVRILRAVRMASRFGLRIEPATLADIRANLDYVLDPSPERIRDEFITLLSVHNIGKALRTLDALDILAKIIPEIDALRDLRQSPPHQYDVLTHTMKTAEHLHAILHTISPARTDSSAAQAGLGMIVYHLDKHRPTLQQHFQHTWPSDRPHDALLTLAALLHDSGKAQTQTVDDNGRIRYLGHEAISTKITETRGESLRLSNQEIARLTTIVKYHMRPHQLAMQETVSKRAVYRFWRDCGAAGVDVCLLAMADYLATVGPTLEPASWSNYLDVIDTLLAAQTPDNPVVDAAIPPLLTGHDLMAMGMKPGPQMGALIEQLREAQIIGEITTVDEARQFIINHKHQA